jgi:hypothetical protein
MNSYVTKQKHTFRLSQSMVGHLYNVLVGRVTAMVVS